MSDIASQPEQALQPHATFEARRWLLLPILAALAFLVMTIHAARIETPTVDEMAHIASGVAIGKTGRLDVYWRSPPLAKLWMTTPLRMDPSVVVPQPPFPLLGWGPWAYGTQFMHSNQTRYLDLVFHARLMTIPWGLLAAWVIFLWVRTLWDVRAAAMTASLFLLCPNTLAHAHLATLDMACTATILLALGTTHWACLGQKRWAMVAAGAALGLALSVKFTALLLVPVMLLIICVHRATCVPAPIKIRLKRAAFDMAILLFVAALLVNVSIAFKGTGQALGSFQFASHTFQRVQSMLPASLPMPAPAAYVSGADDQQASVELGEFRIYLMGQWSTEGWWYYNLIAMLVKTPEPFVLLVLAGIGGWIRQTRSAASAVKWWQLLAVCLPALVILLTVSALGRMNIGLRYVLPAMPLLFIVSGACIVWMLDSKRRFVRAIPAMILAYAAVLAALNHPSHLAFFNPLSGGPAKGHRWLLDSNIDWGQDLYRVPAAVAPLAGESVIGLLYFGHADPALYGIKYRLVPPFPVQGVLAVSVNFLLGQEYVAARPDGGAVMIEAEHLRWLRTQLPIARAGSIWIFDTRNMPIPNQRNP